MNCIAAFFHRPLFLLALALQSQEGFVSGVFAAGTVALVVVALAPFARYIPKAALAGLLLVTAARLVDWKRLSYAMRASRYDAGLVLVTALSAVFISVEFSIRIGVALSILLFVPRAALLRWSELVVSTERVVRACRTTRLARQCCFTIWKENCSLARRRNRIVVSIN